MAIISSDYDGDAIYYFSLHDQSVVLKQGTVYSYTGADEAFVMDYNFGRFLIGGMVYARADGIQCTATSATIDVAAGGLISADSSAIDINGAVGFVTIDNYGTIAGSSGIVGGTTSGYCNITNIGTINVTGFGFYAIQTGIQNDKIINTGTINGAISTGGGNDTIDTHLGTVTSTIFGGAGDDTYVIAGGQAVSESFNGGNDLIFSYADYSLPDHVEQLYLLGSATQGHGNGEDNRLFGNDLGDHLSGGGGDDELSAGAGDDVLRGGAGDDTISTTEGSDQLFGGAGNDLFQVGLDHVSVSGGVGTDVVAFLLNDTAIVADLTLATGIVTGGAAGEDELSSIEGIWGTEFNDTLTGNALVNDLLGYLGDDTISGGAGNDVIEGYAGADTLDGGDDVDMLSFSHDLAGVTASLLTNTGTGGAAAGDTYANFENVRGGVGNDVLTGSAAANVLEGGNGNDVLNGDKGADTLYGDLGNDTLTGGIGADVFGFRDGNPDLVGSSFGQDTITDFQDKVDRVSFVGNSLVHSMSDLTVSQSGTSTVVSVNGTLDRITLLNFSPAKFTSADVLFGTAQPAPAQARATFGDAAPNWAAAASGDHHAPVAGVHTMLA